MEKLKINRLTYFLREPLTYEQSVHTCLEPFTKLIIPSTLRATSMFTYRPGTSVKRVKPRWVAHVDLVRVDANDRT